MQKQHLLSPLAALGQPSSHALVQLNLLFFGCSYALLH